MKIDKRLFVIGILLIFAISMSFTYVEAPEEERELEIGVYDDYLEIMSYYEGSTKETGFEVRADTSGKEGPIAIEMEYYEATWNSTAELEYEFEMSVLYKELIEFIDDDDNGEYNTGDTIVKTLPLGDQGVVYYDNPTHQTISEGGANGYLFTVSGNITGTIFIIRIYVFAAPTTLDTVDLDPTEVKIDIEIQNFDFDNVDSLLGLKTHVTTYMAEEFEVDEQDEVEVEIEKEGYIGGYSISDEASIDGITKPVGISSVAQSGQIHVYSAYEQGDIIIHDPVLGIREASTKAFGLTNLFWLAIIPVVFIGVNFLRKRK